MGPLFRRMGLQHLSADAPLLIAVRKPTYE
jgi:hypothetical protein